MTNKKTPRSVAKPKKAKKRKQPELVRAAGLPTVSHERQLEMLSELALRKIVHPWLVTSWREHDYGIDCMVEIASERPGTQDRNATGKRFAVQLKATENSPDDHYRVRVKPESIVYWHGSTEPTMLVIHHSPTDRSVYAWIDDQLISDLSLASPDWRVQDTVTVKIPSTATFDTSSLSSIEARVVRSARVRNPLSMGRYFDHLRTVEKSFATLKASAESVGFSSVVTRLDLLGEKLRSATYIVALTGKSRAGKSTLLNALVQRDVSPVGKLPTTAVSMLVIAGASNEAEITFLDGSTQNGTADSSFLSQFATQEDNPENAKKVRHIVIRLLSEELSRGVMFVDAPGLHDASSEIRAVTKKALESAHCIVYVIDVSGYQTGSFSVDESIVSDLTTLRGQADKIMVALNKADVLGVEDKVRLAKYIRDTLARHGFKPDGSDEPVFLSAQQAWDLRSEPAKRSESLGFLDQKLWNHLLATNSLGVFRLQDAIRELVLASQDFIGLMATRQTKGEQAATLTAALAKCNARSAELLAAIRTRTKDDAQDLERLVDAAIDRTNGSLRTYLNNIPRSETLPSAKTILEYIQPQMLNEMHQLAGQIAARVDNLAAHVDSEVEKVLDQARIAAGMSSGGFHVKNLALSTFEVPGLGSHSGAWGGLLLGGALGLFISPAGVALAAFSGWILGLMWGDDDYRRKQLRARISRASEVVEREYRKFAKAIFARAASYRALLEHQVQDRVRVFIHDVERQLAQAGAPLQPAEAQALENVRALVVNELKTLSEVIEALAGNQNFPGHS